MSLQVSVEGIMYLAKRVDGYQGVDVQLVYENDEYKAKRARDENGRYYWDVEHEISGDPGKVIGCYAFAYREGFPPVFEYLKAEEVQHNLTGTNSSLWKKYYNDMFKKHVLKRAAKRQFGIEISEDDVPTGSATDIPEYNPQERRDITNEVNSFQPEQPETEQQSGVIDTLAKAKAEMKQKFLKLGITDKEAMGEYINKHAKPKGDKPTLQEMVGLLQIMDMHIELNENQSSDALD